MCENVKKRLENYYNQSDAYLNRMIKDTKYYHSYLKFIERHITERKGKFLDIGCGAGVSSWLIAKNFPELEVLGIDISEKFINYAKENYSLPNLKYLAMDACQLKLEDESYDFIGSNDVIEHIPDVEAHLSECDRILKNNGVILIESPNYINPLMPFYSALSGKRIRGKKYNLLQASAQFAYLLSLYISKCFQKTPRFIYIAPILDDNIQTAEDIDAVFLSNPLDLKCFFKSRNYTISQSISAVNWRYAIVKVFFKSWLPIFMAARKNAD